MGTVPVPGIFHFFWWYRNRYRKNLVPEKSIRTGIGKIWYRKKYWYRYHLTFWVPSHTASKPIRWTLKVQSIELSCLSFSSISGWEGGYDLGTTLLLFKLPLQGLFYNLPWPYLDFLIGQLLFLTILTIIIVSTRMPDGWSAAPESGCTARNKMHNTGHTGHKMHTGHKVHTGHKASAVHLFQALTFL